MKERAVIFAPEARDDLFALYDWIADAAGTQTAIGYIERLEAYCKDFPHASERGQLRNDIRPNLRIIGFERRVVIAFTVDAQRVTILRMFYGGMSWETDLS